ncbi:MAG: ribbon-helix-helix protein, CopG family [Sideroxyarcus sp.]|nr:ribbon-helix-helix protein, CopG family [Sideroxyarcus sp.]
MGTLTLRLPEKLDQQLTVLAAQTHQNRSKLARAALEKFVHDQEREQLLAGMVEAFRFLATNPEARAESIAIAEEFAVADSEALDIAEGRKPGEPSSSEPEEQWWK